MRRIFAIVLLTTACASKSQGPAVRKAQLLSESVAEGGLVKQLIDINGDGEPNVFNFYREREEATPLLVKKEVDLNLDGKIDVRTYFGADGEMEKEEMDGDFDGRADWIDHYISGKRVKSEIDTDYDGNYDLWKIYEKGILREKHRDTDNDGRIDFREKLDEKGNVLRTSRDTDGDGRMDERED